MTDHKIAFTTITPDGHQGSIRMLKQVDMVRCPHVILEPSHFRDDGTCRCNDPTATVMRKWGYRWNRKRKQWV